MRKSWGFRAPIAELVLSLLAIGASGCTPNGMSPSMAPQAAVPPDPSLWRPVESGKSNVRRVEVDTQGGSNILVHVIRTHEAVTVGNVREALGNRTRITTDPVHGMQIAYSSSDGKVYLWYPGNSTILKGYWKPEPFFAEFVENKRVLRRVEETKVCFDYGSNTFNPATGHTGAGWECAPLGVFQRYTYRNVEGDLFGLAARTEVPLVLQRRGMSIEELQFWTGR